MSPSPPHTPLSQAAGARVKPAEGALRTPRLPPGLDDNAVPAAADSDGHIRQTTAFIADRYRAVSDEVRKPARRRARRGPRPLNAPRDSGAVGDADGSLPT